MQSWGTAVRTLSSSHNYTPGLSRGTRAYVRAYERVIFKNPFFILEKMLYICRVMEKIEVTIQELRQATRPNVYRNRKKYSRKPKHKLKGNE